MFKEYPTFDKNEILVYLRKSRSDDPLLELNEILYKHETILDEYAEKYLNGRVPNENKYREIKSSETIDERPEMLKLLKEIEKPEIKAVLVVEVQRLSRGDLEDVGRIIKLFRYTNTYIITPQKTYDLTDEYDRDVFERELKRGNDYLEYTKKILNRGKLVAVKEGNYIATYAPYGYKKISYKEDKRKVTTLEIIPEHANVVEMIFDLYVYKDMGFKKIANTLNEMHIDAPNSDYWKNYTISEILSNIVYTGKIRWQHRPTVKHVEKQELIKSRPRLKPDEYLIFDGKHPAIISDELFNAAQLKRGKNIPLRKNKSIVNPLAGIFYCEKCGHAMRLRHSNVNARKRFECTEMKYCNNGSAVYDDVMQRLYDALEVIIKDFEIKLQSDNDLSEYERNKSLIETLERKQHDLEIKEVKMWEKYTVDEMPKTVFDKMNANLQIEKQDIQNALSVAYEYKPQIIDYNERVITFKTALNYLRDINTPADEKNRYLRQIISKITYKRDKPIQLTKDLAEKMGVQYTHRLCWHNSPFELKIELKK